jgi:hypothetical protein
MCAGESTRHFGFPQNRFDLLIRQDDVDERYVIDRLPHRNRKPAAWLQYAKHLSHRPDASPAASATRGVHGSKLAGTKTSS